jgi:hypothetical protein
VRPVAIAAGITDHVHEANVMAEKTALSVICASHRGARPHFAVPLLQFALLTVQISTPTQAKIRH